MTRKCSRCGAPNRVPPAHLADDGTCGKCKGPLASLAEPVAITTAAMFDDVVRAAKVPVLVDFWATWCGPCRMVAPEVARAAEQLAGRAVVLKVDTDRVPELAHRYGVSGIPNFVVFRDGAVVFQKAGAVKAPELVQWAERA